MIQTGPDKYPMSDFKEIIASKAEIKQIVSRIAGQISSSYAGKKLLVCGILKGAFIFMSDLVRQITIPAELTFMKASSYGGGASSSGDVKVAEFSELAAYGGFDILVIDDILDTGRTLCRLKEHLSAKGFASVEFCALLDKAERRESEISVKYVGKKIKNEFVVGYGLDYAEKYRDLPFIAALDDKIYGN